MRKRLCLVGMIATMMMAATGCGMLQSQSAPSNEEVIESFVSSAFNTIDLKVGDEHKPQAAVWLPTDGGTYSSDESVVTVTSLGKVTAVGKGSAYVIIRGQGAMYQAYLYNVSGDVAVQESTKVPSVDNSSNKLERANNSNSNNNDNDNNNNGGATSDTNTDTSNLPVIEGVDFASEIENFVEDPFNVIKLSVGEKYKNMYALWTQTGAVCYTSDESVVTVASNGAVTAQGKGVAYVIIKTPSPLFAIIKYVVE